MGNHLESYKTLIGKKIQKRRIEMGFPSQGELAKKLGTDASQVSRWESGKHMPEGQLKLGLCDLLQVEDSFFELIELSTNETKDERSDLILSIQSLLLKMSIDDLETIKTMAEGQIHLNEHHERRAKKS